MNETDHTETLDTDGERVLEWRAWCLVSAGYDIEDAYLLAADSAIDLHAAIDLVEAGCPADLAVSILR